MLGEDALLALVHWDCFLERGVLHVEEHPIDVFCANVDVCGVFPKEIEIVGVKVFRTICGVKKVTCLLGQRLELGTHFLEVPVEVVALLLELVELGLEFVYGCCFLHNVLYLLYHGCVNTIPIFSRILRHVETIFTIWSMTSHVMLVLPSWLSVNANITLLVQGISTST